jgi:outer membrane protein assembly factor BamB
LLCLLALVVVAALGTGSWLHRGNGSENGSGSTSGKSLAKDGPGPLDVRETVEKRPGNTVGRRALGFYVDDMNPGDHFEMPGMWATDRILAKGINKTIIGLRIGTDGFPGDETWALGLDGPICGYTHHVTGDNRTAVLFRANDREKDAYCNQVGFVDLDDGRLVWEARFSNSPAGPATGFTAGAADSDRPSVTLTHGTVAVTWGGGTIAYDMEKGTTRWATRATSPCQDLGAAGGGALIIRQKCGGTDDSVPEDSAQDVTYKVRKVDPGTGRTLWTYSAADDVRDLNVPSTEPAVIAVARDKAELTDLISLDDKGGTRATVGLGGGAYLADCPTTDHLVIDDCPTVAVGDDQVFVRSKNKAGKRLSNRITGFDLATGDTTRSFRSAPGSLLRPVRMSGDQLLALRVTDDHVSPNTLVGLDPETGEETPYFFFDLPGKAENLTSTYKSDILVQNGRLFFGVKAADRPADETGKQDLTYLILGIEGGTAEKP